jgi:ABC-2 type transport system ATP-binding protein
MTATAPPTAPALHNAASTPPQPSPHQGEGITTPPQPSPYPGGGVIPLPPPYQGEGVATESHPIIETHNVSMHFGKEAAVHGLSFSIPAGKIFGLIGPSGSGKTTTVRLLAGLYKPTEGEVHVMGEDPRKFRMRTRERIGYMPQQFVLYPQLSVWENLNFVASLYGMPWFHRNKRLNELLDFVELREHKRKLGSQLSGGMQRRLAVAAAMVNDPVLIFADEPTAGVDPVLRAKFWENFRALREQGRTLFVTTQYVGEAVHCDYIGVMREGRLIELDTPENLRLKALGGEVIRLVVDTVHEREAIRRLDEHPAVNQVQRSFREPGQLFVYTDDAATTLPALVTHLDGGSGIQVQSIDKYEPPFDDVFVNLMKQDDAHV